MLFHRTKLRLPKGNRSSVMFIKLNVNFKFHLPAMFVFLVFHKSSLTKVVHVLNIYQNTKFHGPTVASFASTSEI
jgi:hypothetical protein